MLPDRALYLPAISHLLIVKHTHTHTLSLSLSLNDPQTPPFSSTSSSSSSSRTDLSQTLDRHLVPGLVQIPLSRGRARGRGVVRREKLPRSKTAAQHPATIVANSGNCLQTPAKGGPKRARAVETSFEKEVAARQPVGPLALRSFVGRQVLVVGIWWVHAAQESGLPQRAACMRAF